MSSSASLQVENRSAGTEGIARYGEFIPTARMRPERADDHALDGTRRRGHRRGRATDRLHIDMEQALQLSMVESSNFGDNMTDSALPCHPSLKFSVNQG